MCRFFAMILAVLAGVNVSAALPQYVNDRVVTNQVVDAFEFINNNAFYVGTRTIPWDAQNVTNWVNSGVMAGAMGFRFDTVSESGSRRRSSGFRNEGIIQASDSGGFFLFTGTQGGFTIFPDVSHVTINASNIVNRGQIRVGPSGIARLSGNDVDLTGSAVLVDPLGGLSLPSEFSRFGFFLITETNFFPDPGIYDQAWGIDISTNTFLPGIVTNPDPLNIITPPFNITNSLFSCGGDILFLNDATAFVYATSTSPTNLLFQIVTVTYPTNLFDVEARFLPQTFPFSIRAGNGYLTPAVSFTSYATDLITDQEYPVRLFVMDQLGSATNETLLVNLSTRRTFRPAPIIVSRGEPFSWTNAPGPTDFELDPSIIYNGAFSNQIVTNIYAAYGAMVESTASRLPNLPDVGITNSPGRVEIQANNLNLRKARIRAEGLASIKGTNFMGSADAVLDAKHLQVQLTSNTGPILFDNLSPDFVERFGGPLKVFSMVWTNLLGTGDTNVPSIEIAYSLTAIDASQLHTIEPSYMHQLALKSQDSIVLDDSMTISNAFTLSAPRLVVNQRLRLEGSAVWDSRTVTNVSELVINTNASISSFGLALYERGNGQPLTSFENHGTLLASSHIINATTFASSGSIISTNIETLILTDFCYDIASLFTNTSPSLGPIRITASEARFDGGAVASAGDLILNGETFKMRNTDFVGKTLRLNVTGTLTDAGPDSDNTWTLTNGITMTSLRPVGDFFGTHVQSLANPFTIVEHVWSAADLGTNLAGFTNGNLAIGQLSLNGGRRSEFAFLPAQMGQRNALYVDLLEIDGYQATNITELIDGVYIDPNFTIYYADLRSTNSQITAESVNKINSWGQGEGRMVWVPGFAGPNSSVDIARLDGRTEVMNRALRLSFEIDSDGDGIANAFDPFPLDPGSGTAVQNVALRDGRTISVPSSIAGSPALDSDGDGIPNSMDQYPFDGARFEGLTVVQNPGKTALIRFTAAPQTTFTIEYRDSLASGNWQALKSVVNTSAEAAIMEVADAIAGAQTQRFYRVVYTP